ncbi:unnamed protein product [Lactuca virosa]|uniref:Uncharacterized protein n=1 Tax=Lactuca virosa TaxID=75947 RepID=A0AAU9N895_9ASTR|nr:unnamed protein product [Lactuca virosa]
MKLINSSFVDLQKPQAEVKVKLKGHQKQIRGLAFSQTLSALVSSGADAQANCSYVSGILMDGRRGNQETYSRHLAIHPNLLEKPKFNSIMINAISLLYMKAKSLFMTTNSNA